MVHAVIGARLQVHSCVPRIVLLKCIFRLPSAFHQFGLLIALSTALNLTCTTSAGSKFYRALGKVDEMAPMTTNFSNLRRNQEKHRPDVKIICMYAYLEQEQTAGRRAFGSGVTKLIRGGDLRLSAGLFVQASRRPGDLCR